VGNDNNGGDDDDDDGDGKVCVFVWRVESRNIVVG